MTETPYPTIAEKVALFKENGIAVLSHFEKAGNEVSQLIHFGNIDTAEAAAKVAKEHGIKIHELCVLWKYGDDGEPNGECRSILAFP